MKISDVIRNISDMVDTTPTERSSGDNTSKFTAFTGDLTLVELPDGEDEKRREPGTMPSGNDAMPEDLYLPPLQLKSELLKKAVDVENVFDDGTPAVRYDEEYGDEGWHGDESDHDYIGAPQTAEQVDGAETEQPDPNETSYDPYSRSEKSTSKKSSSDSDDSEEEDDSEDDEKERADESLQRILQLANLRENGDCFPSGIGEGKNKNVWSPRVKELMDFVSQPDVKERLYSILVGHPVTTLDKAVSNTISEIAHHEAKFHHLNIREDINEIIDLVLQNLRVEYGEELGESWDDDLNEKIERTDENKEISRMRELAGLNFKK